MILKLLVAWRDPLWHFHQSMAHHHDFNNFSSNKALEMSDMVHELRKGVEKVAEKVLCVLYECQREIVWEVVYISPAAPKVSACNIIKLSNCHNRKS